MSKGNKKRKLTSETKIKITLATLMSGLMVGGLTPIILDLESSKNEHEQMFISKPSTLTTNFATAGFPASTGQDFTTASTNDPSTNSQDLLGQNSPLTFASAKKTLVEEISKRITKKQITLDEVLKEDNIAFDTTPFTIDNTFDTTKYTITQIQEKISGEGGFQFIVDLTIETNDLSGNTVANSSIKLIASDLEHTALITAWNDAYYRIYDDVLSYHLNQTLATDDPNYPSDDEEEEEEEGEGVKVYDNDGDVPSLFFNWLKNPSYKWYTKTITDQTTSTSTTTIELSETIPTDTTDTTYSEITKQGYSSYGEYLKDKTNYETKSNTKYDIKGLVAVYPVNFPSGARSKQDASSVEFTDRILLSSQNNPSIRSSGVTFRKPTSIELREDVDKIRDLNIYLTDSSFQYKNPIEDRVDFLIKGKMQWHDGVVYDIRWTDNKQVKTLWLSQPINVPFNDLKIYNQAGDEVDKTTLTKQQLDSSGNVVYKPVIFQANLYVGKNIGDDDTSNDVWKIVLNTQETKEYEDPTLPESSLLNIKSIPNENYRFKWSDVYSEIPTSGDSFLFSSADDPTGNTQEWSLTRPATTLTKEILKRITPTTASAQDFIDGILLKFDPGDFWVNETKYNIVSAKLSTVSDVRTEAHTYSFEVSLKTTDVSNKEETITITLEPKKDRISKFTKYSGVLSDEITVLKNKTKYKNQKQVLGPRNIPISEYEKWLKDKSLKWYECSSSGGTGGDFWRVAYSKPPTQSSHGYTSSCDDESVGYGEKLERLLIPITPKNKKETVETITKDLRTTIPVEYKTFVTERQALKQVSVNSQIAVSSNSIDVSPSDEATPSVPTITRRDDLKNIDNIKITFNNQNLNKYGGLVDKKITLLLKGKMQWHDGSIYDIRWLKETNTKELSSKQTEIVPFNSLEIYDSSGFKINNLDLKKQQLDSDGNVDLKPIIFNFNLYLGENNVGKNTLWNLITSKKVISTRDSNLPESSLDIEKDSSNKYNFKWNDVYSEIPNVKTGYVVSDNDRVAEEPIDVSSFLSDHPYSRGFSYVKRSDKAIFYKNGDILRNAYGVPMIFQVTGQQNDDGKSVKSNLSTITITAEELQQLRDILLNKGNENDPQNPNIESKIELLTSTKGTSFNGDNGVITKFKEKGHEFEGLYTFRWYDLFSNTNNLGEPGTTSNQTDYYTKIQKRLIQSPIFKKLFYQISDVKTFTEKQKVENHFQFKPNQDIKDYEYDTSDTRLVKRRYDFDINRGYPTLSEESYNERIVEDVDEDGYFEYVRQDFKVDPVDGIIKANEVFITLKDLHLTINPHDILKKENGEQELDTGVDNNDKSKVKFSLDKVVNPLTTPTNSYCDGTEYWNSKTSAGSSNQEKAFGVTKGLELDEFQNQPLALSTSSTYPSYLPCSNFEGGSEENPSLLKTELDKQSDKISTFLKNSGTTVQSETVKNQVLSNSEIYQKSILEIEIKNPEYTRNTGQPSLREFNSWTITPTKNVFDKLYKTEARTGYTTRSTPIYQDRYYCADSYAIGVKIISNWGDYHPDCDVWYLYTLDIGHFKRREVRRTTVEVKKYANYNSTPIKSVSGMSISGEFYQRSVVKSWETISEGSKITVDATNFQKNFIGKGTLNLNSKEAIDEFNKKIGSTSTYSNQLPVNYNEIPVTNINDLVVGKSITIPFIYRNPTDSKTDSKTRQIYSRYEITAVDKVKKTVDVKSSSGGYTRSISGLKWYLSTTTNGKITENKDFSIAELTSRLSIKTSVGKKVKFVKDGEIVVPDSKKHYGYYEIVKKETTPSNTAGTITTSKYTIEVYTPKSTTITGSVPLNVEIKTKLTNKVDAKKSSSENKDEESSIESIKGTFEGDTLGNEIKPTKELEKVSITTAGIKKPETTRALIRTSKAQTASVTTAKPISIQRIEQKLDFQVDRENSYGQSEGSINVKESWRGYTSLRLNLPIDEKFTYDSKLLNQKFYTDPNDPTKNLPRFKERNVNFRLVTINSQPKTNVDSDNKKVKMVSAGFNPEDIQQKVIFSYSNEKFNKVDIFADPSNANYYQNVKLNEFIMDEYGMWLVGIKTKTGKVFWELYYLTNSEFEEDVENPTDKPSDPYAKLNWKSRAAFSFGIENVFTKDSFLNTDNLEIKTNPTNLKESTVSSDEDYYWNAGDGIVSKNNDDESNFDEDIYLTTPTYSDSTEGENSFSIDPNHPTYYKAEYKIESNNDSVAVSDISTKNSNNKNLAWSYRSNSDFTKEGLKYGGETLNPSETVGNFSPTEIDFSPETSSVPEKEFIVFDKTKKFKLNKDKKAIITIKFTYNIFDKDGNRLVVTKRIHWNDPQSFIKTKLVDETKKTQQYINLQREVYGRLNTLIKDDTSTSTKDTITNKITELKLKISESSDPEKEKITFFEYSVLTEELKYLEKTLQRAPEIELEEQKKETPDTSIDFYLSALNEIISEVNDNSIQNVAETYVHWNNLSDLPTEEKGTDEYNQKLQKEVDYVNNLRKATIEKDKNEELRDQLLNGFTETQVKTLYDALKLFIDDETEEALNRNSLKLTKTAHNTLQSTITTEELDQLVEYLQTRTTTFLQQFKYPEPTEEQKEDDSYLGNYDDLNDAQKKDFLRIQIFNSKLIFNELKKIYFQINKAETGEDTTYDNKVEYKNNKYVGSEKEQITKLNLTTFENVVQVMFDNQNPDEPQKTKKQISETLGLKNKINQLEGLSNPSKKTSGSFEKAYVIDNRARKEKILDLINVKTIAHYNQIVGKINSDVSSYKLPTNFPVIKIYKSSIYTTTWKEYAVLNAKDIEGNSRQTIKGWLNDLDIFNPTLLNQGKYMIVFLPANNRDVNSKENSNPNILVRENKFPYLNIVNLGGESNEVFTEDLVVASQISVDDAFSNANNRRLTVEKSNNEIEGTYKVKYKTIKTGEKFRPFFYSARIGDLKSFEKVNIADKDEDRIVTSKEVSRVKKDNRISDVFKTTNIDKISTNDFYQNSEESTERIYRLFTEDLTTNNAEDLGLKTIKSLDNGTKIITEITLRKLFQPLEIKTDKKSLSYYLLNDSFFKSTTQKQYYLELISKYSDEYDIVVQNTTLKTILSSTKSPFNPSENLNKESYSKMKALIKINQETYLKTGNINFTSFGKYTISYTDFENFNNPVTFEDSNNFENEPKIKTNAKIETLSVVRIPEQKVGNEETGDGYPYDSSDEKPSNPFYFGELSPITELKDSVTNKLKENPTLLKEDGSGDLKEIYTSAIDRAFSKSTDSLSQFSDNIDDDYIKSISDAAAFGCNFIYTVEECVWSLEDLTKVFRNRQVSVLNQLSEEQINQLVTISDKNRRNELLNSEGFLYKNEIAQYLTLDYLTSRSPEYLIKKLSLARKLLTFYKNNKEINTLKFTNQKVVAAIKEARKNQNIGSVEQTLAYRVNLLRETLTPIDSNTDKSVEFIWDETNKLTNLNSEILLNPNVTDVRSWGVKIEIDGVLYYIEQENSPKNVENVERGSVLFEEELPEFTIGLNQPGSGFNTYVDKNGDIVPSKKLDVDQIIRQLTFIDNIVKGLPSETVKSEEEESQLLETFLSTLKTNTYSRLVDSDYLTSSKFRNAVELDVHNPDKSVSPDVPDEVEVDAIKVRTNNLFSDVFETFFKIDQESTNEITKTYYRKINGATENDIPTYEVDSENGRYIENPSVDGEYILDTSRNYILDNFQDYVSIPSSEQQIKTKRSFVELLNSLRGQSGLKYTLYYSNVYDSSYKLFRVDEKDADGKITWKLNLTDSEVMDFLRKNKYNPYKLHLVVSLNDVEKFRFNALTYSRVRGRGGIQDFTTNKPFYKGGYNLKSLQSTTFKHLSDDKDRLEDGFADPYYTFNEKNVPTKLDKNNEKIYLYYQDKDYLKEKTKKNIANLIYWNEAGQDLQKKNDDKVSQNKYYFISKTKAITLATKLEDLKNNNILKITKLTLKAFPSQYTIDTSKDNWYYTITLTLNDDNEYDVSYQLNEVLLSDEVEVQEENENKEKITVLRTIKYLIEKEIQKVINNKKINDKGELVPYRNGGEYIMRTLIESLQDNVYLSLKYETKYSKVAKDILDLPNLNVEEIEESEKYNLLTNRKPESYTVKPLFKDDKGEPTEEYTETIAKNTDVGDQKRTLLSDKIEDLQTLTQSDLKETDGTIETDVEQETNKFKFTEITKSEFDENNKFKDYFQYKESEDSETTFLISPKFFDTNTKTWLLDKDIFNQDMFRRSPSKTNSPPYVLLEPPKLSFTPSVPDPTGLNPDDKPNTITPTTPTNEGFLPGLTEEEGIIAIASSLMGVFLIALAAYLINKRRNKGLKVRGSSLDDKF